MVYIHEIWFSGKKKEYERTVYSIFDMLGDVGGLQDGLIMIFQRIVGLFSTVFFAARQSSQLFYYIQNDKNKPRKHNYESNI